MTAANCTPVVSMVIDPRFPGGTSSAVAEELRAIAGLARIRVHAVSSDMFRGHSVAPPLRAALDDLGLELIWDSPRIAGDLVVIHNPAFLKFNTAFAVQIVARHVVVVTHENFLRPGGEESFDVGKCLGLVDRASTALRKSLAPVSPYNRRRVMQWLAVQPSAGNWRVLERDWFNICAFDIREPAKQPRDRRGRHSRPGFEKFPRLAALDMCFPESAESNVILGADLLIKEGVRRPHWRMIPFRGIAVEEYFGMIDFMVYFTSPVWRESFGRVLAESVAAGKLAITDKDTGANLEIPLAIARPEEVDGVVQRMIENPAEYRNMILQGQRALRKYSAERFREHFADVLDKSQVAAA